MSRDASIKLPNGWREDTSLLAPYAAYGPHGMQVTAGSWVNLCNEAHAMQVGFLRGTLCERGAAERLKKERDDARRLFEDGCRYMVLHCAEDAEEFCPPWISLTLWLTQLGLLAREDVDEWSIEADELAEAAKNDALRGSGR